MRTTVPLSANISFMFADRPFLDRIAAAGKAGFPAVECHFPYDHSIPDLRKALKKAGVRLTGINTAPGDQPGDWGLACDPKRRAAFRVGVRQALRYAKALDVPTIHVMAGMVADADRKKARRAYVANLRWAAEAAAKAGRTIVTEPLNARDKPGYFISRSDEVVELIREVGHPALKLMFDCYHVQIMEGDVTKRLEKHWPFIGHVQIAAVPSRNEPGEGELDHRHLFGALKDLGYSGYVGCEYKPRGKTEDGLGWIDRVAV
ncbi:MAG: hydroxypyruvate isomerase family protein [Beijerinckiaceae bacterium]